MLDIFGKKQINQAFMVQLCTIASYTVIISTNLIYGALKIVQPVIYYPSNWRFFSTVSEEPHDHDALGPLGATGHLLGEAWRRRAR